MAQFPLIALGLGLVLGALVVVGGNALPLLTQLIVTEFAFIVTAIGAVVSFRRIFAGSANATTWLTALGCAGLSLFLLTRGVALWPL